MKADEIYDLGYAIPAYDIDNNTRIWRFRKETSPRLPVDAVALHKLSGVDFDVAKWSDVKEAMEKK